MCQKDFQLYSCVDSVRLDLQESKGLMTHNCEAISFLGDISGFLFLMWSNNKKKNTIWKIILPLKKNNQPNKQTKKKHEKWKVREG